LYSKVKNYFNELANNGNKEAIELLKEYEEMKISNGDFIAAKYLIDIYKQYQIDLKEVNNG
jgi:hypothetical protein